MSNEPSKPRSSFLKALGPGILVAATGVGAGDLATGAFVGSNLGVTVLWAVVVGAFFKFVVNEGLARWQLATGKTLIDGAVDAFSVLVAVLFLPYLFLWSFFVGSALMSACGATFHAIAPVFDDAGRAKQVWGVAHSVLGIVLVLAGGFRLFEKVMSVCIAIMFVTVVVTSVCLWPGTGTVLSALVPNPRSLEGEGLEWTVALMGGVGGTVTVLCYGYWIREMGREDASALGACRLDLGIAYGMTALFGIGMVIIGSHVTLDPDKGGATLIVDLAERLEEPLGPVGKWAFLIGAWGAVFSSLFGVWQSIPYIFADVWGRLREKKGAPPEAVDTRSRPYRSYLLFISIVPMVGLVVKFQTIQRTYAIVGAMFVPLLGVALLILNTRRAFIGEQLRNRWPSIAALVLAIVLFGAYVVSKFR